MENDNYSDEDNFTFNVKTDFSQAISNQTNQPKINSKKEKKEKYLEMKMLKNKRKRDKIQPNKKLDEIENSQEAETITKKVETKKESPKEQSENKTQSVLKQDLYDELNNFYEAKDKKLKKLTYEEKNQQKTKKRALEKEISEELKEVKEQKKLQDEVQIKKDSVFSVKNFEDLDINTYLKKTLAKNNYTQMTKIQKQTIPILLEHKNVIVKSETGSGKTLAYVIPLFEHLIKINEISKIDRKEGVYSVIFAPTHELCMQIEETFNKLKSACIHAVYGTLMGGQKIDREKQKLRKGLNIIVCTPGRLLYHLKNTKNLKFDKLKFLIFDEADRLLDMGFEKDIKECLKTIVGKCHHDSTSDSSTENGLSHENFKKFRIFLISATIDNKIRNLVNFLMKGFKSVGFTLKNEEDEAEYKSPSGLSQYYSVVYDEFRLINLIAFVKNNLGKKIMIFVSTCDLVNYLQNLFENIEIDSEITENFSSRPHNLLKNKKDGTSSHSNKRNRRGKFNSEHFEDESQVNQEKVATLVNAVRLINTKIYPLHGKMNHQQRKEIFKDFNKEGPGILIATDVASRGLDFPMVDWIIHYDINPDPKEYLNRMGRTARLDQTGNSIIFLMNHEKVLIETCFKNFKENMKEIKSGNILLDFVNNLNRDIYSNKSKKIELVPEPYNDEVDENEKFRKKYSFAVFPLQNAIKSFIFKSRDNLLFARKAFKSSIRSYVTFNKHHKDVFVVKNLNLTRYVKIFYNKIHLGKVIWTLQRKYQN